MHVSGPRWRIVTTAGPEGKVMMKHLLAIDPSGRSRQLANQVHVLIKGYVPGVHFGELSASRAFEVFGSPGDPSAAGLVRLEELGRVLALDVLCNNGDRFPLIWDNRGNPGNTMLATGAGKVRVARAAPLPVPGASAAGSGSGVGSGRCARG